LASLAGFTDLAREAVYADNDGPRVVKLAWVQPSFFRTLGVPAMLGRTLVDDDATRDTARVVVVLTHATWQRLFGGSRAVLGRVVRLDGSPCEVVGVLPRGFVAPGGDPDFYLPLDLAPLLRDPVHARASHWLALVARLKPGVRAEAAQRELAAIATDLAREYPRENASIRLASVPLRDAMVGDTRTPLLVLLASAGLVLLITCANLAGALLSRTISRRKEFAVRVALGAGRGRLVRQLLAESTLLALAGGAAGLVLATAGLAVLRGLALPTLPAYADLSLDRGAVLVTFVLALCTGIVFGVAPALSAGRSNAQGMLREEARGASEGHRSRRLRGILVAGQIALCVSLLAATGLLARSLWALTAKPLGFDPDGVLTAAVELPPGAYSADDARLRFYQQFEERLRALPGVTGVATASAPPGAVTSRNGFSIEGSPWAPGEAMPFVLYASVSDGYFRTLGIPFRAGRTFAPTDRLDAPPAVVISEGMARRYWPHGNALGAHIRMGPDPNSPWITVIGIVGDVRNGPAQPEPEPTAYGSIRQFVWGGFVMLRTRGDPLALVKPVRRELAALDPGVPLHEVTTLRARVDKGLAARRLPVVLMAAFGALALLLASVGVYAMFASMAAAREREFGVRVALGSSRGAIAALVLRQGGLWMALGLAGGAVGVVVVARLLRGLLVGVAPSDPVALGAAVVILLIGGTVALLVPVRRATRADPIAVLR
jgi:predicted permease